LKRGLYLGTKEKQKGLYQGTEGVLINLFYGYSVVAIIDVSFFPVRDWMLTMVWACG